MKVARIGRVGIADVSVERYKQDGANSQRDYFCPVLRYRYRLCEICVSRATWVQPSEIAVSVCRVQYVGQY
jgi:hypothetical protein